MKAIIFVGRDMKYHTRSCNGHGPAIINIGQHFTFAASNSAPTAHFNKRPEDPPWHNRHYRTDIVKFGQMPTQFWITMARLYREVSKMNPDIVTKIGKMVPHCAHYGIAFFRALAELGFLGPIGHSKFERLLIVFKHWTMTTALTRVIFQNKYISLIQ